MKIRNKLLLNFAFLLCLMLGGFVFSIFATYREHETKGALSSAYEISLATENVRHQMVENHLALSNYLITATPSELDHLSQGNTRIFDLLSDAKAKTSDPVLRAGLTRIEAIEHEWYSTIAERFVEEHRSVISGNTKAMDLLDQYTETGPTQQLEGSNQVIDEVQSQAGLLIQKSRDDDDRASLWATGIDIFGFIIALSLGVFIAFRTARAITRPLEHLITVAREISEKGDLDQEIAVGGNDEIGTLSQTLPQHGGVFPGDWRRFPRPLPAATSRLRSFHAPTATP